MKNVNELDYSKLNLSKETKKLIKDIDPKDLITLSFKFEPIPGVGEIRCKKITNALIEAGFLPNFPFEKDGDIDFLCEVLGVSPKELYEKYDIIDRKNPARGIVRLFSRVFDVPFAEFTTREFYTEDRLYSLLDLLGDCLTPRRSAIIKQHFGLYGQGTQSFEKVGKLLGYSRDHVWQLEKKAIESLRRPDNIKKLKDWYFPKPNDYEDVILKVSRAGAAIERELNALKPAYDDILQKIEELKRNPVYSQYERLQAESKANSDKLHMLLKID